MAHRHEAKEESFYGWSTCIDSHKCDNPAAHGGVVSVEVCACGAVRKTEVNGNHKHSKGWVKHTLRVGDRVMLKRNNPHPRDDETPYYYDYGTIHELIPTGYIVVWDNLGFSSAVPFGIGLCLAR